jgi:hypothetical protein
MKKDTSPRGFKAEIKNGMIIQCNLFLQFSSLFILNFPEISYHTQLYPNMD